MRKSNKKLGRPINPNSARQKRISLIQIIEESKKSKGRPKGSFKYRNIPPEPSLDIDELIQRIDNKLNELNELQKEVKMTLKFLQLQNQY